MNVDLPDPLTPDMQTSLSSGIVTEMRRRLFAAAPRTMIASPAACKGLGEISRSAPFRPNTHAAVLDSAQPTIPSGGPW